MCFEHDNIRAIGRKYGKGNYAGGIADRGEAVGLQLTDEELKSCFGSIVPTINH
jgi:hypothetical protein